MPIRVILVDDHIILREGLRVLLERSPDIKVVGQAGDGRAAIALARKQRPTVVIMDVAMHGMNGVEATRRITAKLPGTKVLGLSIHCDPHFVDGMLRAGAWGYVTKECASPELEQAVRALSEGRKFLSPRITGLLLDEYLASMPDAKARGTPILTSREVEVLQLLAEGKATKEIAWGLEVSVKTIETHRQNIMGKLRLFTIAELTKYAIRRGLTSLDR